MIDYAKKNFIKQNHAELLLVRLALSMAAYCAFCLIVKIFE